MFDICLMAGCVGWWQFCALYAVKQGSWEGGYCKCCKFFNFQCKFFIFVSENMACHGLAVCSYFPFYFFYGLMFLVISELINWIWWTPLMQVFPNLCEWAQEDTKETCNGLAGIDSASQGVPSRLCVQCPERSSPAGAVASMPCSTWDTRLQVHRWWVLPQPWNRLCFAP